MLRGFDEDVCAHLQVEMVKKGITVLPHQEVAHIEKLSDGTLSVALTDAQQFSIEVDAVLYATGRVPNTQGLGLAVLGVALPQVLSYHSLSYRYDYQLEVVGVDLE
jgi:glutathione reductase (NADPH)